MAHAKNLKAKTHLTYTRDSWTGIHFPAQTPAKGIEAFENETFSFVNDNGELKNKKGREVMNDGAYTAFPVSFPINKILGFLYNTSTFKVKFSASWHEKGRSGKWAKLLRVHSESTKLAGACEPTEESKNNDFFYSSSPEIYIVHSFKYDYSRNDSGDNDSDNIQNGTLPASIIIRIGGEFPWPGRSRNLWPDGQNLFFDPSTGMAWFPIAIDGMVSSTSPGHPKVNKSLKFNANLMGKRVKIRFPWFPGWVDEEEWSVDGGGSLTVEHVKLA